MKAVTVTLLALVCLVGVAVCQFGAYDYYGGYGRGADNTGGYIMGLLGLLFILFFLFVRDDDFTIVGNFSKPSD